jgi:hypothetical protein
LKNRPYHKYFPNFYKRYHYVGATLVSKSSHRQAKFRHFSKFGSIFAKDVEKSQKRELLFRFQSSRY